MPPQKRLTKKVRKDMANAFCRCVKKLEHQFGPRGIGICTASVFNRRGYRRRGTFSCKPSKVDFVRTRKQRTKK